MDIHIISVVLKALGAITWCDCSNTSAVIVKNIYKIEEYQTTMKHKEKMSCPLPWACGIPVAIQQQSSVPGTWTPVYTGIPLEKELLVASVFLVCFQWSSSGFPVVLQCVPIMQTNTGWPLGYHRVLALSSVVPVASQCTYDSSDLPVCSNYAN